MPSLVKHDPKAFELATKDDINQARRMAETVLMVSGHELQFDNISRQRMKDVLASMNDEDKVDWFFYDGRSTKLTKYQLYTLIFEAEQLMGQNTLKVFARAKELKDRLESGERVTKADLRLKQWRLN